jgi:hypothetical protein
VSHRPDAECDLCGNDSGRLETGLGWFRDQGPKTLLRCVDHDACRRRVEETGEWPLESADEARLRRVRTTA